VALRRLGLLFRANRLLWRRSDLSGSRPQRPLKWKRTVMVALSVQSTVSKGARESGRHLIWDQKEENGLILPF
jgi:hypothetical protein